MNKEIKVGLFSVIGLLLMIFMFVGLNGINLNGDKGYKLYVSFKDATGLTTGNDVCYAGVKIGQVEEIAPAGKNVVARISVNKDTKIPKKSHFIITASGVMGAKFINIYPLSDADFTDVFRADEYVEGIPEQGMEALMGNLNKAMLKIQDLLDSMNRIIGDRETQAALKDISFNMRDVSANINVLSGILAEMAIENRSDVRQTAANLEHMTASLMRTANTIEAMVNAFNGDGETGKNLREAIQNLRKTSERIDNMAASLEGVVTDPQVSEDLKATLHNVRGVTQKADKMMGRIEQVETTGGLEVMYSNNASNWKSNMDLTISTDEKSMLKAGIVDIGEGNRLDLQGGIKVGDIRARGGIIESKAGLGVDLLGGKKWQLSMDAFDPNEVKVKSRVQYEIGRDLYLFTQVEDINRSDSRKTYFGLRKTF